MSKEDLYLALPGGFDIKLDSYKVSHDKLYQETALLETEPEESLKTEGTKP